MGTVTVNSVTINNSAAKSGGQFGPFYNSFNSITSIDFGQIPWTNNSMYRACRDCYTLNSVSNLNPNITNMRETFSTWAANEQFGCSLAEPPTIPNSVIDMGHTFYACHNLKNAPIIPPNVTTLDYTFYYCKNITIAPIIPNKVKSMCNTFAACYNLTSTPIIPDSVLSMEGTFLACYNLTSAPVIPTSVTILNSTFQGCNNLSGNIYIYSIQINNAVNCFYSTTAAKNVYIPFNAVLGIYTPTYNAFFNAGYKTSSTQHGVTIKENPHFINYNNWWVCDYDGYIYKYLGSDSPTAITLPNSINNISTTFSPINTLSHEITSFNFNGASCSNLVGLFSGCSLLTEVTNMNTSIQITNMQSTYYNCQTLTTVPAIPNTVITLRSTFMNCQALSNFPEIPDSVTDMSSTFDNCLSLTNAANLISNSVVNMGQTFIRCNNLVIAPAIIPNSVTDIGAAFYGCTSLITAPIIGENVTNMYLTFYLCASLSGNVYIKSKNITIASSCFTGSHAARKNVYIPFTYPNGVYTQTYNSFTREGYKTDGSYQNVYLMNYTDLYSE